MPSDIEMPSSQERFFLQIIHGSFNGPFVEAARATCKLIKSLNNKYFVVTVFLYGEYDHNIAETDGGDEIVCLNAGRRD